MCELSTALSKSELELRMKEDEVLATLKKLDESGEEPDKEVIAKLIVMQNEVLLNLLIKILTYYM